MIETRMVTQSLILYHLESETHVIITQEYRFDEEKDRFTIFFYKRLDSMYVRCSYIQSAFHTSTIRHLVEYDYLPPYSESNLRDNYFKFSSVKDERMTQEEIAEVFITLQGIANSVLTLEEGEKE